MHDSCQKWVAGVVNRYKIRERNVLEVGSLNVNGGIRHLFTGPYIGVDQELGDGVDLQMDAKALQFEDERFDVVISVEMLEHDPTFWESVKEMGRVLKKGGLLILSARGNGFPEHRHPMDYWRFMPDSFPFLFFLAGCTPVEVIEDSLPGMFGVGRKNGAL